MGYLLALQYLDSGRQVRKFDVTDARYRSSTNTKHAHQARMYAGSPMTRRLKKNRIENLANVTYQHDIPRMRVKKTKLTSPQGSPKQQHLAEHELE
jgi:chromosome segregation and condensation protein ScpB